MQSLKMWIILIGLASLLIVGTQIDVRRDIEGGIFYMIGIAVIGAGFMGAGIAYVTAALFFVQAIGSFVKFYLIGERRLTDFFKLAMGVCLLALILFTEIATFLPDRMFN